MLADISEEGWEFSEAVDAQDIKRRRSILSWTLIITKPFWIFLVVVDLVAMAIKNNDMTQDQLDALDMLETIFSLAFLFEILLRMLAQRKDLRAFFKDRRNSTDFLISVITCIIQIPSIKQHTLVYIWFTGFQVLRIYRVVMAIPRLRNLMVCGEIYV